MFDGIFIHYLINELKIIENIRINKVNTINDSELFFTLSNKQKLLISVNSNSMHIRLSNQDLVNSPKKVNFHITLKKYLESSIINKISQYNNDRIVILHITNYDDLGYNHQIKLIIEFFGRNSNIILVDESNIIIDCLKRVVNPIDDFSLTTDLRVMIPKGIYNFPSSNKINPFALTNNQYLSDNNNLEGVSSLLFNQISLNESIDIINSKVIPCVYISQKKKYFYCFELNYLLKDYEYVKFDTLSSMLDYYYISLLNDISLNNEQIFLNNYVNKEIKKITEKINKQKDEKDKAFTNLKYEQIGNLLASNLYLVKKGAKNIEVLDFYNDNNKVIIDLDPLLSPNQNLTLIFNRYQKAKRALKVIDEQISKSNDELKYYQCLKNQLSIPSIKINDLYEIIKELDLKGSNHNFKNNKPVKVKPSITVYHTYNDDIIYVGKNNIQNNYITHTLANSYDYFFHIQAYPGSHVIVKTKELNDELITLAGSIAAYYSTFRNSSNVCVDYTQVKNLKKVPGIKGSFVTYNQYKSVFCKPDIEYIKKHTKI